jgi:hypothetical protein
MGVEPQHHGAPPVRRGESEPYNLRFSRRTTWRRAVCVYDYTAAVCPSQRVLSPVLTGGAWRRGGPCNPL